MHVTITTEEVAQELPRPKGFLRNLQRAKTRQAWEVRVSIKLSEEERAIIDTYNLWERPIYTHTLPPEHAEMWSDEVRYVHTLPLEIKVTIQDLINGTFSRDYFYMPWYTPWDAKKYADELRANILPTLKDYLTVNRTVGAPDSFEL
jgi:hypothetical protein